MTTSHKWAGVVGVLNVVITRENYYMARVFKGEIGMLHLAQTSCSRSWVQLVVTSLDFAITLKVLSDDTLRWILGSVACARSSFFSLLCYHWSVGTKC